MQRRSWWPLLWASWIFATSCTVVARPSFIRAIGGLLPSNEWQQAWAQFWIRYGIIVIKGYHVTEYTILCMLLFRALRSLAWSVPRALCCSAAGCIAFAASDEWHQTFVPGRGGTWVDVCIDSLGVGLASFWILKRTAQQSQHSAALGA